MSTEVTITRAPADPVCTRVSVGGNSELGFYCTFRGDVDGSIAALDASLNAMRALKASGVEIKADRRYKELGAS